MAAFKRGAEVVCPTQHACYTPAPTHRTLKMAVKAPEMSKSSRFSCTDFRLVVAGVETTMSNSFKHTRHRHGNMTVMVQSLLERYSYCTHTQP